MRIGPGGQKYVGAREISRLQGYLQRIVHAHALCDTRVSKMGLRLSAYCCQTSQICSGTAWSDTVYPHPRSQFCCQLPNHPYHGVL